MELRMSSIMMVIQYASKFMELSKFVPKFILPKRLKMGRFEEGLASYIYN